MPVELAPAERTMWEKPVRTPVPKPSDEEINAKHAGAECILVKGD